MLRRVVIVILTVSVCQSFNVDIFEPVIRTTIQTDFSADLVNRDLFGYRVALHPDGRYGRCLLIIMCAAW